MNIDPQEVQKFDDLSYDWWDEHGSFKTLHDINPLRLSFIEKYCKLTNKKIVDVGCGGGILTEALAKAAKTNVVGIDMAEQAISAAKVHAKESELDIDYLVSPIEDYADQHPGEFDVITCMELLEHVPNPASLIKACRKLAKPNAAIYFSTINRNWQSYTKAILAAEYCLKLLPKGTHDYQRFIKPSELAQLCREAGLKLQEINGIRYNPFNRNFTLHANCQVNYMVYCKVVN